MDWPQVMFLGLWAEIITISSVFKLSLALKIRELCLYLIAVGFNYLVKSFAKKSKGMGAVMMRIGCIDRLLPDVRENVCIHVLI